MIAALILGGFMNYGIEMPPPEYDHTPVIPFIETALPVADVNVICRALGSRLLSVWGCATVRNGVCYYYVPGDLGDDFQAVIRRHERGHCNGWQHN